MYVDLPDKNIRIILNDPFVIIYIILQLHLNVKGAFMKTEKNILLAFILNLSFSIFELIGGAFTGSVAILSDALHDLGDASSIGISFFLERKSKKSPDKEYTYGYMGYSVIGGAITTLILLIGSVLVIVGSVKRLFFPVPINYDGMIIFAVIGFIVNIVAAFFTRGEESINQRAVNLHMLEDSLGWVAVLVGAIVMRFTNIAIIDPIISIALAVFIFISACKNGKSILDILLFKAPSAALTEEIIEHVSEIDGVIDVHHVHVWSIDSIHNYATMHVVTSASAPEIKKLIREELAEHGIHHSTIELESAGEVCAEPECHSIAEAHRHHHHHHHHHHH